MPNCVTMRRARSVARCRSSVRAGRDLAEDHLLGRAPAQQHGDLVEQLGPRHEVAILERQLHRVAERAEAARDHRHLVHAIGRRQDLGEQRVARLVVRDDLLLARVHQRGSSSRGRRPRARSPR